MTLLYFMWVLASADGFGSCVLEHCSDSRLSAYYLRWGLGFFRHYLHTAEGLRLLIAWAEIDVEKRKEKIRTPICTL